jgi:hypothetical protein
MLRTIQPHLAAVFVVSALAAGAAIAAISGVRAEPQPALDRSIVERLVRAEEAQTRALEKIASAAERCGR